jgi:hypothetical protein
MQITNIRQQLNDLLATIETDQQALHAEQVAVARATEDLLTDQQALHAEQIAVARATEALLESPAIQAAMTQGQQIMRGRVIALIDYQLEQLRPSGTNALVLQALRRQVLEVEV